MSHFERSAVMRTPSAEVRGGGKGIDVARVARALKKDAKLLLPVGTTDINQFASLLNSEGIPYEVSEYQGNIRVATMYQELNSSVITIVNEEGPAISSSEWSDFLKLVDSAIQPHQIVAVMGSFPRGIGENEVTQLAQIIHQNQGLIFLDTAPHFMEWFIRAGVEIVSPNLDEAEAVLAHGAEDIFKGETTHGEDRAMAAAVALCDKGVKVAIVHAGSLGAAIAIKESYEAETRVEFVPTIPVQVASVVGAGDSMAAGFILKSEEQGDVSDFGAIDWVLSLKYGTATASASCELGRSGDVIPERVEELFAAIVNRN